MNPSSNPVRLLPRLKSARLLVLLGTAVAALSVYGADTASDRLKFVDQSQGFGRGLFTGAAGASGQAFYQGGAIGFNEDYFLNSYFAMYEGTQDTLWLYRLADQIGDTTYLAGTVLGDSVPDMTGLSNFAGTRGWPDPATGHPQIKNPGFTVIGPLAGAKQWVTNASFETYTGTNNLPDGWSLGSGALATDVFRVTGSGVAFDGSAAVTVQSNGTEASHIASLQQQIGTSSSTSLTPGYYEISAYMRCQSEQTNAVVQVIDSSGNSVGTSTMVAYHAGNSAGVGAGYEMYVANFRVTKSDLYSVNLRLVFNASVQSPGTGAKYSANFDLVQIWSVPDPNPLAGTGSTIVQNGDFELPGSGTPTSWTCGTGATSTSALEQFESGAVGLAINSASSTPLATQSSLPNMTTGVGYVLSFWGRVTNPNNQAEIGVKDLTTGLGLSHFITSSTTGQFISFDIGSIPGSATDNIQLQLYNLPGSAAAQAYFDSISIVPVYHLPVAGWTTTGTVTTTNAGGNPANPTAIPTVQLTGTGASVSQDILNYTPDSGYSLSLAAQASDSATTGTVQILVDGSPLSGASFTLSSPSGSTGFTFYAPLVFTAPAIGHRLTEKISITSGSGSIYCFDNTVGEEWPQQVHEGITGTAMLRFANLVFNTPALQSLTWNGTTFLTLAEHYTTFVANNLFSKWDAYWVQLTPPADGNNGTGTYTYAPGNSTDTFATRSLPYNQNMSFAAMCLELNQAENAYNALFPGTFSVPAMDKAWSRGNDIFRNFFANNAFSGVPNFSAGSPPTSYATWHYWDPQGFWDEGSAAFPVPDDAHTQDDVRDLTIAYNLWNSDVAPSFGSTTSPITAASRDALSSLLTGWMWNGNLTSPAVIKNSAWVSGTKTYTATDVALTQDYLHWGDLAQFNRSTSPGVHDAWDVANAVTNDQAIPGATAFNGSGDDTNIVTNAAVAAWSKSRILNGGFETPSDTYSTDLLPMNWARVSDPSPFHAIRDQNSFVGRFCATILTDGTTSHILTQPIPQYEPNTVYTVSFVGQNNGITHGVVSVTDNGTVIASQNFNNPIWAPGSFAVRTPVAGHDLEIQLSDASPGVSGGQAWFDEVRALPEGANSAIANGGFELADWWDATLPRYWTRNSANGAAVLQASGANQGTQCAALSGTASGPQLVYSWHGFLPSGTSGPGAGLVYTLSFWAQTSAAGGVVKVVDTTTGTTLKSVTIPASLSSWTQFTSTFTSPSTYSDVVQIQLQANSGGTANFDDVEVTHN